MHLAQLCVTHFVAQIGKRRKALITPVQIAPQMRWRTPALSSDALQSLIEAVSTARSLPHVSQLHQHLTAAGLSGNPSVATKLLQLYADGGDLHSARRLFSSLPSPPSIFAWTPILALLSRSALHRRCLAAYSAMRSASVAPDSYVLPVVIRSSAALASALATAALQAESVKFAADGALPVANALIDAYSKAGDVGAARRIFDLLSGDLRDRLSWNSIIAAYAFARSVEPALDLLRAMRSDGCEPDLVTWNSIMDGFCRSGRCDEARDILVSGKLRPNVVSWTTVVSGYSRSGYHDAALEVFSRMMSGGTVPPDHETLSCVISSCRHVAALATGRAAHGYGLKCTPSGHTFYCAAGAALMTMYAGCGKISAARSVFSLMDLTDVVTWNAAIRGFSCSGMHGAALKHFTDMILRGVRCDPTTVSTVLPLCGLRHGKETHAHAIRRCVGATNLACCNALIAMYARSGRVDAARRVFDGAGARDVVTWNAIIGAYGTHGLGSEALALARLMLESGVAPDSVTLTNVLTACARCGLVDEALRFFEGVSQDFDLAPGTEQCACLVDLLSRAGRFEEAVTFIRRMPSRPGARVWGALLAASLTHQNVEFGHVAFEQLVGLEPENSGNYVTMANIYVRAGRLEDAEKVRMMMEGGELVKPSGHSWLHAEGSKFS